jgi:hypothetical protein
VIAAVTRNAQAVGNSNIVGQMVPHQTMVAAEHAVADRGVVSIAGTADPIVGIADFVVETADSVAVIADSVAACLQSAMSSGFAACFLLSIAVAVAAYRGFVVAICLFALLVAIIVAIAMDSDKVKAVQSVIGLAKLSLAQSVIGLAKTTLTWDVIDLTKVTLTWSVIDMTKVTLMKSVTDSTNLSFAWIVVVLVRLNLVRPALW